MEEEDRSRQSSSPRQKAKFDDGQVEPEDIAPEKEDVADPEEMLRPAGRIGRARGSKKFLERMQRSVPPVVTMRLIVTYFLPSPVLLRLPEPLVRGMTRQGLHS